MQNLKIETSRLIMRPFTESDAAAVKHFTENEFEIEEAALEWIRWISKSPGKRPDTNRLLIMFAIELKQTGECIGRVYLHSKAELNCEVEIGYGIAKGHRCNGYATEAAKAAVWFAFEKAEQEVLCAIVKPENIASRRVVEKVGFVYGGVRTAPDENGIDCAFNYFRLYLTDSLPGPEWDARNLYKAEPMGAFFNKRADGYNNVHLSSYGEDHFIKFGSFFPKTGETLRILDVGCGTGLELDYIWAQTPNAHITYLDLSRGMLDLLIKNHPDSHDHLTVVEASYLDWEYPDNTFDIVTSRATMHHLWEKEKVEVYRKILKSLKPGGGYIENDFMVDAIAAEQYQRRYENITASLPNKAKAGEYHIDIPFTLEVQERLLRDAGFNSVEVLENDIKPRNGSSATLKARKGGKLMKYNLILVEGLSGTGKTTLS
jgi:RimJ/RimL family protein N-acetyltransferase/ubiquinone/menaquinone biosynthesis C-methylase UbiE